MSEIREREVLRIIAKQINRDLDDDCKTAQEIQTDALAELDRFKQEHDDSQPLPEPCTLGELLPGALDKIKRRIAVRKTCAALTKLPDEDDPDGVDS